MLNYIFENLTVPTALAGTLLAVSDAPSSIVLTMFGIGISSVTGALVYVWRQQVQMMNDKVEVAQKLGSLEAKSQECDRDRHELRQQIEQLKKQ